MRCSWLLHLIMCNLFVPQPSSPWRIDSSVSWGRLMKLPSRLSPAFVSGVIDTASNQRHLQLSRAKQMLQFGKLQLSDEVHRSVSQVLQQAAAPYAQGAPCILEKNVISAYQTRKAVAMKHKDPIEASRMHSALAMEIKDRFVSLGPTFIKLGQLLSTRPDLIAKEYTDAFKDLQDRVPPFSGEEAMKIIQQELGSQLSGLLLANFDCTPLASASIGQVHLAEVEGRRVAVKVQRPNVKELFRMDLNVLKLLVSVLNRLFANIDGVKCDWQGIFEEYVQIMYRELDYRVEGLQGMRFKNNFAEVPWVKVPAVLMNMSTSKVLTMEYVPGIKINDISSIKEAGLSPELIATRLAESYLTQLCQHGFSHCDQHPGNLACDNGHPGGRIIYYDFGMMNDLKKDIRANFVSLILSMYENDVKGVYQAFCKLGLVDGDVDQDAIMRVLTIFVDEFSSLVYTNSGIYTSQLSQEEQDLLLRQRRLRLGSELVMKLEKEGLFKLPASFTFIIRSFNCLDGVGKSLDPKYDMFKIAQPYVSDMVSKETGLRPLELQFWRSSFGRFILKLGFGIWRNKDKTSGPMSSSAERTLPNEIKTLTPANTKSIARTTTNLKRNAVVFLVISLLVSVKRELDVHGPGLHHVAADPGLFKSRLLYGFYNAVTIAAASNAVADCLISLFRPRNPSGML